MQDNRQYVGNCVLWWGVDSQGYTTEIKAAGVYKGSKVVGMRDTDVPWPKELVLASVCTHVRAEPLHTAAAKRREEREAKKRRPHRYDDTETCTKCGHRQSPTDTSPRYSGCKG